ncbi:MAG: lipid A biosynthesis acyltransferase [Gammaproteobacteria bacterium]|nr:lipid A biosynthesis acyltransferase [Gammaproteobacteria bacterium]MDH5800332.1 lipid A biosynthesis acyltransferase [Gammaproteobacteria bacterium]
MGSEWKKSPERGSPLLVKLILWVALHIGRTPTRVFLYPITLYFLLAVSKARRASFQFFTLVLQHPPSLLTVARHFHCFASTILDRVYFLCGRFDLFKTKIENLDLLLNTLAEGKGCILLGSHLGSFEVLRAVALKEKNIPLKVFMRVEQNATITKLLDTLNPDIAKTVIPLGTFSAGLAAHEFLNTGGMLGILGDRVSNDDKTVECQFMGKPTLFPTGPLLMASILNVPVVLIFGLYRGGNRYDVHFELLTESVDVSRKTRDEDIQRWVQLYAKRLEHYTRMAPYNWFNYYDYWNTNKVNETP